MDTILSLAPQNVWKHFHSLTQIPRPSGHLEKVQAFLLDFGKNIGVETFMGQKPLLKHLVQAKNVN